MGLKEITSNSTYAENDPPKKKTHREREGERDRDGTSMKLWNCVNILNISFAKEICPLNEKGTAYEV